MARDFYESFSPEPFLKVEINARYYYYDTTGAYIIFSVVNKSFIACMVWQCWTKVHKTNRKVKYNSEMAEQLTNISKILKMIDVINVVVKHSRSLRGVGLGG